MNRRHEDTPAPTDSLPEGGKEALSTLRAVWSAQGQTSRDLEDPSCRSERCKATASLSFEGLAEVEATTNTTQAVDNLQSAWKRKLEREGKLHPKATSLRDLVLEQPDQQ